MSYPAELSDWIVDNGGEVLAITNPYELARFKAEGKTHIIYTSKNGKISYSSGDAKDIYASFNKKQHRKLSERPAKYSKSKKDLRALMQRDGNHCFFCLCEFTEQNPATLEHLVARRHGGPDHMSNYVLAHESCNREVDTLSVAEKVQVRERNLAKKAEANHENQN